VNTTPYKFRHKAAARTGAPLIFTFHGTGGDENQFFTLAEQLYPVSESVTRVGIPESA